MRLQRLLIPLLVVGALGALLVFGLLRGAPDKDIESVYLGQSAPGFSMELYEPYHSEYGPTFDFAEYAGRPMVVNFWASWCLPCYQEAPVLQEYWRQYQDSGVLFVGIHTQNRDHHADGLTFLSQFGLSFPNGYDPSSEISIDWGVYGVPETFFVDADGRVILKHIGPVTPELMDQQLKAMLQ